VRSAGPPQPRAARHRGATADSKHAGRKASCGLVRRGPAELADALPPPTEHVACALAPAAYARRRSADAIARAIAPRTHTSLRVHTRDNERSGAEPAVCHARNMRRGLTWRRPGARTRWSACLRRRRERGEWRLRRLPSPSSKRSDSRPRAPGSMCVRNRTSERHDTYHSSRDDHWTRVALR
jgi:hypothetical protein